jgi:hypothetical protein
VFIGAIYVVDCILLCYVDVRWKFWAIFLDGFLGLKLLLTPRVPR